METLSMGSDKTKKTGVLLSPLEAEEYWEFKRQKRVAEVVAAFTKSEIEAMKCKEDFGELRRTSECAKKLSSAAVRVVPVALESVKNALAGSGTLIDCIVGGTGETWAKAKAYETKLAVRGGAKEISLTICLSAWKLGRTGEIKREIKGVCRAAKKSTVKVLADRSLSYAELVRLGKLAADCGAKYLSVPFSSELSRLKKELRDCCMLEVTGVETASDYKAVIAVGAERIGTSHAEEIYFELMKEAENFSLAVHFDEHISVENTGGKGETTDETKAGINTGINTGATTGTKTQSAEKPIAKVEQMSVLGDKKLLNGVPLK
jgi:deoxyribose-phosphate aldolase